MPLPANLPVDAQAGVCCDHNPVSGARQGAEERKGLHYKWEPPDTHPDGRTLLNELQQLGFGRARVPQHQQVDVSSAGQPIREPGARGLGRKEREERW